MLYRTLNLSLFRNSLIPSFSKGEGVRTASFYKEETSGNLFKKILLGLLSPLEGGEAIELIHRTQRCASKTRTIASGFLARILGC